MEVRFPEVWSSKLNLQCVLPPSPRSCCPSLNILLACTSSTASCTSFWWWCSLQCFFSVWLLGKQFGPFALLPPSLQICLPSIFCLLRPWSQLPLFWCLWSLCTTWLLVFESPKNLQKSHWNGVVEWCSYTEQHCSGSWGKPSHVQRSLLTFFSRASTVVRGIACKSRFHKSLGRIACW